MKQKHMKKIGSFLITGAMVLTMFPTFNTEVHAAGNQLPTKERFATVEQLKSFNTDDTNDGTKNPADVYLNHYGASPLRTTLKDLESSYFTNKEQDLMNNTTVYTDDTKNSSVYSTTDKLYLAYGDCYDDHVMVGKNASDGLNNGLHIDKAYWGGSTFWLRAPYKIYNGNALGAWPAYFVKDRRVEFYSVNADYALVPAFELNLSSVIFASAAPAAASDGQLSENDAFTLRYDAAKSSKNLGSALVSYDKSKVTLTNVPTGTYLVVQNSVRTWAKQITNEAEVSESDMKLDSFRNCKVWLETTDSDARMTYATLADEEQGYDVNITASEGLAVTNGTQGVGQGSAITDITVEVTDGYFLPEDYISNLQGQLNNGLSVTETDNGFTISGTPTSDVNITLLAATKKVYDMAVAGNGTFTTVCKDYQPINANEFTITNNGNVDLENVNVSLTGTNADKFELSENKVTTIQPNGTIKVTVKPDNDLAVGTYQATLSVSAGNVAEQSIALQFTVSEHDYNAVVTPPTCTEKGYTTYTCKNCNHSYKGDEVDAKGHTFGEWEIITSPSCDQGGSRKHTCTVCGYVETENLNPTGHDWDTKYTVDKEPTCTENGSKSIHCKNCDAVKDSTTIAKLGHSFTNYVSDGNATCTENGTETATCERCDKTDTRVQENSALGHDLGEWNVIKNATTTETGIKERHCARCDYKETETIPVISKPAQPNDNNSNKDNSNADTNKESPKTGDQTNAGFFTALLSMSALGIAVLTVLKKKKALEHK